MTESKRLPGAQPGNHNAYKHGYYATLFNRRERSDLADHRQIDLTDEIDVLRVLIRRTIQKSFQEDSGVDKLQVLREISFAASALNRLIRTQSVSIGEDPMIELKKALADLADDLSADPDYDFPLEEEQEYQPPP